MNDLRPVDPFDLQSFQDSFRQFMRPWSLGRGEQTPTIKLELSEKEGAYAVKADIPGVRKEDIDVRVDGNRVSITAEVKKETEQKDNGRVLHSERQYGYASRTFTLASAVDEGKVQARYENGVLELTLPKRPTDDVKRVQVR